MVTAQCATRNQLQEYLSGWAAPEQGEAIEAHLRECPACEQAVAELESDADVLLQSVRRSGAQPQPSATPSSDAQLAETLDRVKQACQPAATASEDASPNAQWPLPTGDMGSYELLRPIGHGGMGSVYLARHRQLGKQLAIKLLSTRLPRSGGYTVRFQREMRAAGGLDHPAIVRATDAGQHNGTHYLAMEYIEGLDLSRVARLVGKLSIADACEIIRQVALGLSHAHAAGVTHRDIKPSNLMLSSKGEVKILDFGLARLSLWDEVSAELTTVGQLIGTLDYMAPEQAERPDSVDYRADLYALGATLFRLLCGRAPLAASPEMSPLAKLRLLATHQPPSLKTLRPDAPQPLDQLVASLLARDPESRPASAAHVAQDLAALTEGADLPALVSQASALALQAHGDEFEHLLPHQSNWPRELPPSDAGAAQVAPARPKPPSVRQRWILWALAPLAILAGVLITLETQKGNLVIESEAADVHVTLLRDGKPVEGFKIEPGATSTRLVAGQYEVTIDGGSDSLVVEGGHVEVRRGETVIARIRQQSSQPAAEQVATGAAPLDREAEIEDLKRRLAKLQGSGADAAHDEPLYGGKPLSYWLDMAGRETSETGYVEALNALHAMVTEENGERISAALLAKLRLENRVPSPVDRQIFDTLRLAHPKADFYRVMVEELRRGDLPWQARILAAVQTIRDDPQAMAPLTEWIDEQLLTAKAPSKLVTLAADTYQALVQHDSTPMTDENRLAMEKAKEHYAQVLLDCQVLGDTFWLAKPVVMMTGEPLPYVTWYPPLGNHIEERAIATLSNPEADRSLVARSLVILTVLNSKRYDRTGLADRRPELIEALRTAWKFIKSDPERLLDSQRLPNEFALETRRYRQGEIAVLASGTKPGARGLVNFQSPRSDPVVWPSFAMLYLIDELGPSTELAQEVLELFEGTDELNTELYAALRAAGLQTMTVSWPSLRPFDPTNLRPEDRAKASPQHWLAAMLHFKAMQTYQQIRAKQNLRAAETSAAPNGEAAAADVPSDRPAGTDSQEPSPAARASSASSIREPLYKGKPLSQWLDTLDRETSYEGYEESLNALQAMLATDNAQEITNVLLGVLKSRAERPRSSKEDECNRIAFTILQTANPGKAFAQMLVKELEDGSPTWQEALLDSLTLIPSSDGEAAAPLTQWLEKNVFSKGGRVGLLSASTSYLLYLAHGPGKASQEDRQRYVQTLVNCETLDDAHWLETPFYEPNRADARRTSFVVGAFPKPLKSWQPSIADRIEQAAVNVLRSNRSDYKLIVQALVCLRALNVSQYDRTGMQDHRSAIVESLRNLIKRWQAAPTELLVAAELPFAFTQYTFTPREPALLSPHLDEERKFYFVTNASSPIVNVSPEALALIDLLHAAPDLEAELVWIFNATSDRNAKVHESFKSSGAVGSAQSKVGIPTWPDLQPQSTPIKPRSADAASATPDRTSELTREDWLAAIVHTQAYVLLPVPTQDKVREAAYRKHSAIVVAEQLRQLDADGDGALNFDEAASLGYDAKKADVNGDERLTADELVEFRTRRFMTPPVPAAQAAERDWARQQVTKYDLNRDGALTKDEWTRMIIPVDGADLNRDGRMTADEFLQFRLRRRQ